MHEHAKELPTMAASAYAHKAFGADLNFEKMVKMVPIQRSLEASAIHAGLPIQQENKTMRRLVKVLVSDTNENVPLDQSLIHFGAEHMTDLTDQELFFELDMKTLLENHNEKRVKLVDKKVKDRVEYLEPAKVRDLKMVVVTIATF